MGFHILTNTTHMLHIYVHDVYPSTYLVLIYLHPGINTIAWCTSTLFTHAGNKRSPQAHIRIASTEPHLHTRVWEHSHPLQFLPSADRFILPHPLDEVDEGAELPNIPSLVVILPPVPPLWSLCRLALGLPGVTEGGIEDLPADRFDVKQWGFYKGILGHDTSLR